MPGGAIITLLFLLLGDDFLDLGSVNFGQTRRLTDSTDGRTFRLVVGITGAAGEDGCDSMTLEPGLGLARVIRVVVFTQSG